MTTKTITLLPGSRNAFVYSVKDNETTIHYTCPAWPGRTCIYVVPGQWEIESTEANKLHLLSHDVVIKSKPYNIKNIKTLVID